MSVRVKVCGITNVGDALKAADCGASAIGLVFWPASPRCVDVATARTIARSLPPFVTAVGVFVNQMDEVWSVASEVRLSAVQLHGEEEPKDWLQLPMPVIKAVTIADTSTHASAIADAPFATVLLDAHDPVKRGGTGRTIDWKIAASFARSRRVILSGGLTSTNVAEAIRMVRPYAVDVSSGVESAPGKKDAVKLRAFFDAVESATSSLKP